MEDEGEVLQNQIKKISQDSGLRVIGPNCLGLFNSANNFFPTFTTTVNRTTPYQEALQLQVNQEHMEVISIWLLMKEVLVLGIG